jgi:hypothetical protein
MLQDSSTTDMKVGPLPLNVEWIASGIRKAFIIVYKGT